jgi:hypothetical protein
MDNQQPRSPFSFDLVEGVDFYREGQAIVFTAAFHRRRGYCCESGCRHCPFGFNSQTPPAIEPGKQD